MVDMVDVVKLPSQRALRLQALNLGTPLGNSVLGILVPQDQPKGGFAKKRAHQLLTSGDTKQNGFWFCQEAMRLGE